MVSRVWLEGIGQFHKRKVSSLVLLPPNTKPSLLDGLWGSENSSACMPADEGFYYICIKYAGERTASKGPETHTIDSSFWVMAIIVCLRK